MASSEHQWERMRSAPTKALTMSGAYRVYLGTRQSLTRSPVALNHLVHRQTSQARAVLGSRQEPEDSNSLVPIRKRRLAGATQPGGAPRLHVVFSSELGGIRQRLRELEPSF